MTKHQKRVFGPLFDLIEAHVEVRPADCQKLSDDRLGEPSSSIRARVERTRELQRRRFAKESESRSSDSRSSDSGRAKFEAGSAVCNADMRVAEVRQFCKLDGAGESLIRVAMGQMNLSQRGYHRVHRSALAGVR